MPVRLRKTGKIPNEMIRSFRSFIKVAYTIFLIKYTGNRFLNLSFSTLPVHSAIKHSSLMIIQEGHKELEF